MDWNNNSILLTDSYKVSHYKIYKPNTSKIYSYFESRSGAKYKETTLFGLQYFLKNYLAGVVVTKEKIDEAEEVFNLHFGYDIFNRAGWEYILNKHGGYLPLEVKAVPEGMSIPESNVLITVENTDDNCAWLTNYVETLLMEAWYTSTVATRSREMKKILLQYLNVTGDPSLIDFKLHDFGFRGVSCPEHAGLGGSAHLVNFKGTDTFPGIMLLRKFYLEKMAGYSIPASEHSTITSWGEESEIEAMRNMLTRFPDGLIACVSDSYDIYRACADYWGGILKEQVLTRNGTLVIRPDSGDPLVVLPKMFDILGNKFGYTLNSKNYKVLNPKVRVIQGDGINIDSLDTILSVLCENGWSADNIAFGSGGGLLQSGLDRDTQRFAFKCSSAVVDGVEIEVYKNPVTGKDKKSKRGRLKLVNNNGVFQTVGFNEPGEDVMKTVFHNGRMVKEYTLDEIRKNAVI